MWSVDVLLGENWNDPKNTIFGACYKYDMII
jgi:hypothetical protein